MHGNQFLLAVSTKVVSGDIGGSIQKEVHGCRCMQAASGTAEHANVGRCPVVRKLILM